MEVMELAVIEGEKITLIVDGLDEKMATETMASFLLNEKCISKNIRNYTI